MVRPKVDLVDQAVRLATNLHLVRILDKELKVEDKYPNNVSVPNFCHRIYDFLRLVQNLLFPQRGNSVAVGVFEHVLILTGLMNSNNCMRMVTKPSCAEIIAAVLSDSFRLDR